MCLGFSVLLLKHDLKMCANSLISSWKHYFGRLWPCKEVRDLAEGSKSWEAGGEMLSAFVKLPTGPSHVFEPLVPDDSTA